MYRCGEVAAYATESPGNGSVSGIFSWAKASKQHVAWLTNVILSFGTSLGAVGRKGWHYFTSLLLTSGWRCLLSCLMSTEATCGLLGTGVVEMESC